MSRKTILSAGIILSRVLNSDETVLSMVTQVFPVAVDKAVLPYVRYIRLGLEDTPVKTGLPSHMARIEVDCYAANYGESVELAEAVAAALDGKSFVFSDEGMTMRSCRLTDSRETAIDDAFVQTLIFNIKI